MGQANFWEDQDAAQKTVATLKTVKAQTEPLRKVMEQFEEARLAYEMAKEEGDQDLLEEADDTTAPCNALGLVGNCGQVKGKDAVINVNSGGKFRSRPVHLCFCRIGHKAAYENPRRIRTATMCHRSQRVFGAITKLQLRSALRGDKRAP